VTLEIFWFCLIGVFWATYFVLEGFDFGVGMLLPFVARDDEDRRTMLSAVGPVWDGNEVWLVIAAGATFAAFPAWYATMFSGFYLALLLILVLLIVRVLSFEWRERRDGERWQRRWWQLNVVSSVGVPFLWGLALASLLQGVPLNGDHHFTGTVLDLIGPYSVLAGAATVLLFALHGATFLTLRTSGGLHDRAVAAARRLRLVAAVVVIGFLVATVVVATTRNDRDVVAPLIPAVVGAGAMALAVLFLVRGRSGRAFAASAVAAASMVAAIFAGLYPRVIVSHPDVGNSLTVADAASAHYALSVITVVGALCLPVVLLYQGWTYHVLRARLAGRSATTSASIAPEPRPPAG
jgi:cytochrome bd ubiquinol oxidase subunit II